MARLRKYEILLKSFSLGDILVETYNTRSFNDSDFSAVFFFSKGDLAPTRADLRWPLRLLGTGARVHFPSNS